MEISLAGVGVGVITHDIADLLHQWGEDPVHFNRMEWRSGASQWSEGHFLMVQSSLDELIQKIGSVSSSFSVVFNDGMDSITCDKMYLLIPRPIHCRGTLDAMYDVTVVDERYFWQGNLSTVKYNATLPTDRTKYFDDTTGSPNTPYTWLNLLKAVIDDIPDLQNGDNVSMSLGDTSGSSTPRDFVLTTEPAAVMIDRICAACGVVFVASWKVSGPRYYIQAPSYFSAKDPSLIANLNKIDSTTGNLYCGGTSYAAGDAKWLNAVVPDQINVVFPRQDDPAQADSETNNSSPTINQYMVVQSNNGLPSGVSGRSGNQVTLYDDMWAIGPVGSETNNSDLQDRADYLAACYYQRWKINKLDAKLAGFHSWGLWPGIVMWALAPITGLAYTHGRVSPHYALYGGDKSVLGGFRDKRVVGVGGIRAVKTYDGSLLLAGTVSQKTYIIQITASASIGTNQWKYSGTEVVAGETIGTWQDATGGMEFDSNIVNGAESASQWGGKDIQAIPNGTVVLAVKCGTCGTPPVDIYVFNQTNTIDTSGTCDS